MIPNSPKYPYRHYNSGIFAKFVPYIPVSKVSGRNIAATIESTFITSFMRLDTEERCVASTLSAKSLRQLSKHLDSVQVIVALFAGSQIGNGFSE